MDEAREMQPCPCCGYLVFDAPAGSYQVWPICFWEDDQVQLGFPLLSRGSNTMSLYDSQQEYLRSQVSDTEFKSNVRQPNATERRDAGWRPLDPSRDRHLLWGSREDHDRWHKQTLDICLYWWRKEYWLG